MTVTTGDRERGRQHRKRGRAAEDPIDAACDEKLEKLKHYPRKISHHP
jgi:hypothetical protein